MRSRSLLLFLFFFLTACTSFTKQKMITIPTATQEFTPIVKGTFPTRILTSTLVPEPTSKNTLKPKLTNTSTPSRTPTLKFTPTKTPHSNPGFIVTFGETGKDNRPAIPVFSPDSRIIALASEDVRLWDVGTQELIYDLVKPPYWPCYTENVSFNADGSLLAVSIYCLSDTNATGHLLIWDTQTGDLLHDWEQRFSKDTLVSKDVSNSYPATGFAFFPGNAKIAFANANTIEIRDARQEVDDPVILNLGDDMIASDIYISGDSEQLFAFMDFNYSDYDFFPARITQKYTLQIWNLKSRIIQSETEFPKTGNTGSFFGHFDEVRSLSGKFLTYVNYVKGIFKVTDLENWKMKALPFQGDLEVYPSPDTNYVIFFPSVFETKGTDCYIGDVELWDVNTGQILYTFKIPRNDFVSEWCYAPHTFAISPDNNLLAISHNEQVSLWDISNAVKRNVTP
jgi:hypothetical protein